MIYALVDQDTLLKQKISLQEFLLFINQLQIPILQYRDKQGSLAQIESQLKIIRKLYTGTIIVNDAVELVGLADGVHLGQEDLLRFASVKRDAVRNIRQAIGNKIFGLSTHSKEEILEANELEIDYIGLGAYRPTGTKSDAQVGGEALLEIAKLSKHPVALIGGVRLDDVFGEFIEYNVVGSDLCSAFHKRKEYDVG